MVREAVVQEAVVQGAVVQEAVVQEASAVRDGGRPGALVARHRRRRAPTCSERTAPTLGRGQVAARYSATEAGTYGATSPPSEATWRTSELETWAWAGSGRRKTGSTPARLRFMMAIGVS